MDLIYEIYPSTIPNNFFLISNLMKSLKKICQKMLKIESGNKLLMSIKGHNSGLKIDENYPSIIPNFNSYTKFEENRS